MIKSLKNIYSIFAKELRLYFISPIAYVVIFVFLILSGFMFRSLVISFNSSCMTYFSDPKRYAEVFQDLNLNRVIVNFFNRISSLLLFIVPMLTMRLYSEEKKTGTMELLMTSPITTGQVLWGKFLACFAYYTFTVLLTLAYLALLVHFKGDLDFVAVSTGYLGILLLGATFISVGLLTSSLTENQIISATLGYLLLLFFFLLGWTVSQLPAPYSEIMRNIAVIEHIEDFQNGILDTKHIGYYLTTTLFFLFMTGTVVESKRWRQ